MNTYVVLMRAVNVGGKNMLAMKPLVEKLSKHFDDPKTYLASGNVIIHSDHDKSEIVTTVDKVVSEEFSLDISIIALSLQELQTTIDEYPYSEADPKQSGIVFLEEQYKGENFENPYEPDDFQIAKNKSAIFVNCPTGFSETKLTNNWLEKQTGIASTRRNYNTALKLMQLATNAS